MHGSRDRARAALVERAAREERGRAELGRLALRAGVVALVAGPAEVRAAPRVDLLPRVPADVPDPRRAGGRIHDEAEGVAQAEGPDARRVARGVAVEERVVGQAQARVGIDAEDLAREARRGLGAQGARVHPAEVRSVADAHEHRSVRRERARADGVRRRIGGQAVLDVARSGGARRRPADGAVVLVADVLARRGLPEDHDFGAVERAVRVVGPRRQPDEPADALASAVRLDARRILHEEKPDVRDLRIPRMDRDAHEPAIPVLVDLRRDVGEVVRLERAGDHEAHATALERDEDAVARRERDDRRPVEAGQQGLRDEAGRQRDGARDGRRGQRERDGEREREPERGGGVAAHAGPSLSCAAVREDQPARVSATRPPGPP